MWVLVCSMSAYFAVNWLPLTKTKSWWKTIFFLVSPSRKLLANFIAKKAKKSISNRLIGVAYLANVFLMFGSRLLLNAPVIFGFCSLIGICGIGGGVVFLSSCGISSSMGFIRKPPTFGVVTPLPVACIELFMLLLLFVLLLIGAVAFTELFIDVGCILPDVVKPDIKAVEHEGMSYLEILREICSSFLPFAGVIESAVCGGKVFG